MAIFQNSLYSGYFKNPGFCVYLCCPMENKHLTILTFYSRQNVHMLSVATVSVTGKMFYSMIFIVQCSSETELQFRNISLNSLNDIGFKPSIDDKICDSLNHVGPTHRHQYHLLVILISV